MQKFTIVAVCLLAALTMLGCESNDGPAEEAGEKIDNAAERLEDAGKDLGEGLEDACEEATDENC